jgi:hypothetical protein
VGLITIVPPIEEVSFGLWSSMPMVTHKNKIVEHHRCSGKGIIVVSIGYRMLAHSPNIQIVLQIYIWETTSTCSCKQMINSTQHPTLLS